MAATDTTRKRAGTQRKRSSTKALAKQAEDQIAKGKAKADEATRRAGAGLRGKAREIAQKEGKNLAVQAAEVKAEREALEAKAQPRGPRPGSMTSAMLEVMAGKRKGMSAKEVWAEIEKRGLAKGLKGKTPDATVGAKLVTESKKPGGLFERTEPGRYKVRS